MATDTYVRTITAHIAAAPHTTSSGAYVSAVQTRCSEHCEREVELRIPVGMRVRRIHLASLPLRDYLYLVGEPGPGTRYHPESPWWQSLVLANQDGRLGYLTEASEFVALRSV